MGYIPGILLHSPVIPTFEFDTSLATFTAKMAKRTAPGPFDAAPIVQGNFDGSGTPDVLLAPTSYSINGRFRDIIDPLQGTIVFWYTPEKDRDATQTNDECLWSAGTSYLIRYEHDTARIYMKIGAVETNADLTTVAGTTYCIVMRWDWDNTLDGTNYVCISINDSHLFSETSPSTEFSAGNFYIGSYNGSSPHANAIIEGFTVYRRVLGDGTYGDPAVAGTDELALIYASGSGKKPEEVCPEDVVFAFPTNGTVGELATGTGEAWSFPWGDDVLTDGHMQTAYAASGWTDEDTPVVPTSVKFNGTTTQIVVSDGAGIQDLADAELTAEAWFRSDGNNEGGNGYILWKSSSSGWFMGITNTGYLVARVYCATTNAISQTFVSSASLNLFGNRWHHIAMYFNDAGDRKVYVSLDGVWAASYSQQDAGVGAIVSDVGQNLYIGSHAAGAFTLSGALGWMRISNNDRLGVGVDFTPDARTSPPSADANTVWQINVDEGSGTTLDNAEGTAALDGTLSNGTWNTVADMATDAPGARVFNWGYVLGSDAANDGTYQDVSVTAGEDYSLLAMVESDGIQSQPKVALYDVDGTAEIASIEGSAGEALGDTLYYFNGEVPAGCSTMRILVTNSAGVGELYIHKVMVLPNTVNNGGMEGTYDDESGGGGGTVNVAPGWNAINVETDGTDTLDESATAHSGSKSQQVNVDAGAEGIIGAANVFTSGTWHLVTIWLYGVTGSVQILDSSSNFLNDVVTPSVGAWTRYSWVVKATNANRLYIRSSGGAANFLVDDVSVIALDDVSITATAATQANSTEDGGIRVDGLDTLTQDITGKLGATSGKIRFNYTPRHDAADVAKLGMSSPQIMTISYNTDNYIYAWWSATNTVTFRMRVGGTSYNQTWDATGAIVAGTTYLVEIEYNSTQATLSVDRVVKATVTPGPGIDFGANIPDTFRAGTNISGVNQGDAVFTNP